MKLTPAAFLAAVATVFILNFSVYTKTRENAETLARQAISENPAESAAALAELRAMDADGLKTLFEVYKNEVSEQLAGRDGGANWTKIAAALDAVAMQRNSYASGLYWHTDLNTAKKIAAKENKPILSLRLLGNLNEEFSCANSRFFRTILYADANIANTLREKYVLHWQSVRPAPRVTIDFGDGRKIERTITGNSIHYVLDETGAPLDGLPGLYSPQFFQRWLAASENLFQTQRKADNKSRAFQLKNYHRTLLSKLNREWRGDLEKARAVISEETGKPPTAVQAAPLALTKMVTEASILQNITADTSRLELNTNLDEWRKMAEFERHKTQFDPKAVALIQRQLKESKPDSEKMIKLLANLKTYVALDTVRNENLLRAKLHQWFARAEVAVLDKLNERVYAELFLTPSSDQWLGLYSPEIYTALDGEGIK